MLDMEALERVLAPIEDVGHQEETFEVEGHTVTLRPLLPDEDVSVQKYAQEAVVGHEDEAGTDRYAALEFFNRIRIETLAFCLMEVDGTSFRDVEYVSTGKATETGKPVRVRRNVAMRKFISRWSKGMLRLAYAKYGELVARVDQESENLVEYEPSDLDAEIERVERRLAELKTERERRAKGDANVTAEEAEEVISAGQAPVPRKPEAEPEPEPETEPETEPEPEFYVEEEWATFDDVMPTDADLRDDAPPRGRPSARPPATEVVSPAPPRRQAVIPPSSPPPGPPVDPHGNTTPDPLSGIMDSFGDPDDEATLAAEQARIMQARRRMQLEQQAASTGRVPPHRRGATVGEDEAPLGVSGGAIREATPAELAAAGVPPHLAAGPGTSPPRSKLAPDAAMVKPPETLSGRGRGRKAPPVKINPESSGAASRNRNFKPPKR